MSSPKEEPKSLVELSINFRANLYRKGELPERLTTERGRFEEGIWGMQELNVGEDDFVMVFGRTWEGAIDSTFEGVLDTPKERLTHAGGAIASATPADVDRTAGIERVQGIARVENTEHLQ